MSTLTRFELRKLIRRKSALLGLLGIIIVTSFVTLTTAFLEQSYDTSHKVKGFAAITLQKRYTQTFRGELTPAVLSDTVTSYLKIVQGPSYPSKAGIEGMTDILSNDGTYAAYPYSPIIDFLWQSFSFMGEHEQYTGASLTPEKAAALYDVRTAIIEKHLEDPLGVTSYSESDMETFRHMNEKIAIPMKLDYARGWDVVLEFSYLFIIVTCFVLSICTAPVFASEYETGADSIVLSTRHGRSKLISAKLKASFLFASGMFLAGWLFTFTVSMIVYGASGWDLPLQMVTARFFFSPYPLTVLGAFLLTTLFGWLTCLAMVSITLLLSSRMRTSFSVIIWSTVFFMAPLFIPSGKSRLLQDLLALLPGRQTEVYSAFRGYELVHAFGLNFPLPYAIGAAALVITIILLPFAYRGFRKHEVA
ncbi:ABC transporter permease subunit [Gorillibacterium sp. CAU 1737]|uniref:ABC transporter permease subunit n=1 Tax=Gorillibacterium sp. CAU 1737 TaxID=3140362 RepID=UPI0032613B8B